MRIVDSGFVIETPLDRLGMPMLKAIEAAGRTCYKSETEVTDNSVLEFVKKIIKNGHHSVLEHECISVRFICDRGVTHEMVRHRIASYSQESTRFCNYATGRFGNQVTYVTPTFKLDADDLQLLEAIEKHYIKCIEHGRTAQEARYFLPNGLKTEIVMTCNLREWRHFFTLRAASNKAHPQMRASAIPLLEAFKSLIPVVFDDIILDEDRV